MNNQIIFCGLFNIQPVFMNNDLIVFYGNYYYNLSG